MRTNRVDTVKGYKLDFATNTLTVNYKFHRAMSDFGSPEYLRYKEILADFPCLRVIVKAGRTITTTRPTKRLTYENMDSYIGCYENRDELRTAFAIVQQKSKLLASPYNESARQMEQFIPKVKEVVIKRPKAEGKNRPVCNPKPKEEEFVF